MNRHILFMALGPLSLLAACSDASEKEAQSGADNGVTDNATMGSSGAEMGSAPSDPSGATPPTSDATGSPMDTTGTRSSTNLDDVSAGDEMSSPAAN